jgi:hypothetical protein
MESTPGLARKFRDQMRRNQIANLPERAEFGCGWFGISFFFFFHSAMPENRGVAAGVAVAIAAAKNGIG